MIELLPEGYPSTPGAESRDLVAARRRKSSVVQVFRFNRGNTRPVRESRGTLALYMSTFALIYHINRIQYFVLLVNQIN